MNKYVVTIKLETDDNHQRVLDKILAVFTEPRDMVTVRDEFPHHEIVRCKPFQENDLIEIEVREFDYMERHYVEESLSGHAISRTFKPSPEIGELNDDPREAGS